MRRFGLRTSVLSFFFVLVTSGVASAYYNTGFLRGAGDMLLTWLSGGTTLSYLGNAGTLGVSNSVNTPSSRESQAIWTDSSGTLWMFGGYGFDPWGRQGYLQDLWKYSSGQWTWVSGNLAANQGGVYGTKGVASNSNQPGGRSNAATWVDASGNLWLFGGYGYDSTINYANLNDLWKLNPTSNQWTWVSGPSNASVSATGTYGTKGVSSTLNIPGGRGESLGWSDSSGSFWIFGGWGFDSTGTSEDLNDLWKFDPATSKWAWITGSNIALAGHTGVYGTKGVGSTFNTPGARFAAHGWSDSSGNIWLFGGYGYESTGNGGTLNDLWKFNSTTSQWTWVTGSKTLTTGSTIGVYGTKGVGSTSNTPGARYSGSSAVDSSGKFWLFGGEGYDITGSDTTQNELWQFDPATSKWTWVSGNNSGNTFGTYGTLNVGSTVNLPGGHSYAGLSFDSTSGNFFVFGGFGSDSKRNDTELNELWQFNPASGTWTWLSGISDHQEAGLFGTFGVSSTANFPSVRERGACWLDNNGIVWIFGGSGLDGHGSKNLLNDLWKYNPGNGQWGWVSGSDRANANSTYGTKLTASNSNIPGAREGTGKWKDASGNLWLLGGAGYDSSGNWGYLNDLWKYNTTSGQWTWVTGQNAINATGVYSTKGVASTSGTPGAREFTRTWRDAGGNLWLFGGYGYASTSGTTGGLNDLWKFDPTANQWTWVSGVNGVNIKGTYGTKGIASTANIPGGRQSHSTWMDSAGDIWIFGGYGPDSAGTNGSLNDLWKYSVAGNQWTWVSGGNTVAASTGNYGAIGVGNVANVPPGRSGAVSWTDRRGNLWLFGGWDGNGNKNDLWKFSLITKQWTWVRGSTGINPAASYGTLGVPSKTAIPEGQASGILDSDGQGNAWLFGGSGINGARNVLWKIQVP